MRCELQMQSRSTHDRRNEAARRRCHRWASRCGRRRGGIADDIPASAARRSRWGRARSRATHRPGSSAGSRPASRAGHLSGSNGWGLRCTCRQGRCCAAEDEPAWRLDPDRVAQARWVTAHATEAGARGAPAGDTRSGPPRRSTLEPTRLDHSIAARSPGRIRDVCPLTFHPFVGQLEQASVRDRRRVRLEVTVRRWRPGSAPWPARRLCRTGSSWSSDPAHPDR